jgi:hypothetical protein
MFHAHKEELAERGLSCGLDFLGSSPTELDDVMLRSEQCLGERCVLIVEHTDELPMSARKSLDQRRLDDEFRARRAKSPRNVKIVVLIEAKGGLGVGDGIDA